NRGSAARRQQRMRSSCQNHLTFPKSVGQVTVSVDVGNTGGMDGDEVVQLYVRDLYASTA
ncbi:MAG: hypothetical protein WAQ15_05515, partial [Bacillota bacterium]